MLEIFVRSPFLCLATSFYPGRGGPLDPPSSHNPNSNELLSDEEVENEDDWMGDDEPLPTNSSKKHPSKFSKSVAAEASNIHANSLSLHMLNTMFPLETFLGGFWQRPRALGIPGLRHAAS
jgi:hypothetical protein